ncbi:MAG: helix-turn-helix transcriptional regulator [Magnetococcales bacterium]|nr:helix-turn-helix transcriptional regulator [Magnetococcales bacterium]
MNEKKERFSWILHSKSNKQSVDFSNKIIIDDKNVKGSIEMVEPRKGGKIYISDLQTGSEEFTLNVEDPDGSPLSLFFPIQGNSLADIEELGQQLELKTEHHTSFIPPAPRAAFQIEKETRWITVSMGLSAHFLQNLFEGGGVVPHHYRQYVERNILDPLAIEMVHKPAMMNIAKELINCPYEGVMRKLFIEAKLLELVVLHMDMLQDTNDRENPSVRLSIRNKNAVMRVRDRLLADLRAPPSLETLAIEVGMNSKQLNKAFRSFFGQTVFEYLRDVRLEHARLLLEKHDLPLKEIAWRIGYIHTNNFSNAFTTRFGISPGRYRMLH